MAKVIENYIILNSVGSGQYGKVYKGIDFRTMDIVAIKVVGNKKFAEVPKLEELTKNEIETLGGINDKSIVKFIELLRTNRHHYFIYEFCNEGNLEEFIRDNGVFNEDETIAVLKQMMKAFKILRKSNILHRDLKSSNILIHNGVVKLADFGFCKTLQPRTMAQTIVGSPLYMAPEIITGNAYGHESEMWSLGCVLYEMLTGECPYEETVIERLLDRLSKEEPLIPTEISEKLQMTLKQMLHKDISKRLKWESLFELYPCDDAEEKLLHGKISLKRGLELMMVEREKLQFLYDNIVSLENNLKFFNLSPENYPKVEKALYIALFSFSNEKAVLIQNKLLKSLDVKYFPQLAGLDKEDISSIPDYKIFVDIMTKEIASIEKHYKEAISLCSDILGDRFALFTWNSRYSRERINEQYITVLEDFLRKCDTWEKENYITFNNFMDCAMVDKFFQCFPDEKGKELYNEALIKQKTDLKEGIKDKFRELKKNLVKSN